eukprot:XP_001705102.1 Hypothetical protein GL50803_34648 [Giardia lamblia ATCC 50803]
MEEPGDAGSLLVGHIIVLRLYCAVERVGDSTSRGQIVVVCNAQTSSILLVGIPCLNCLLDALARKDLKPVVNLLVLVGGARDNQTHDGLVVGLVCIYEVVL